MLLIVTVVALGDPVFEALAKRIRPLVVKVPVQLPPLPKPETLPTVALVVVRPAGTPVGPVGSHVPDAVVQISMFTDSTVVDVGGVKLNV